MTILEAVKEYIKGYAELAVNAPIWTNYLGNEPVQYAIVPLPGLKIVETYLDGGSLREFYFAFQSMESTADELERLETIGFFEYFAEWMEDQTFIGNLPILSDKKKAVSMEALNWAYLFEQGKSDSGIYQIQCKLVYEQMS